MESNKIICPFLSAGWLGNEYALIGNDREVGHPKSFSVDRLPECKEDSCAIWNDKAKQCSLKTAR